ncbi:MAG: uncharacterized protein A8A55_0280 [Amphiamblys sp. WSBS2006]|nr:MAG: uncharacterized protein A8A55_0280 [Amphiamblys sp. WSBS2006]
MKPETKTILKHKRMFFVFADKTFSLVPESECNQIAQKEEGYVCLKRKYVPGVTGRDTERVICIVCHEEAAPEDFVSPLCRQLHFVLCSACTEYLDERTNKGEVTCPYCKEKKNDKAYQEEIRAVLVSLMPQQTLTSIELRPDTEVKTVTRLTRETKVVLSNVTVSDALFFKLMARTVVTIRNKISLVGHGDALDWCIGELDLAPKKPTRVYIGEYTSQEMKQIYENTKTISRNSIQINAEEIFAKENGICVLLKLFSSADGHTPYLSLESSKKEHIEEILKEESNLSWIGWAKKLSLAGYAVGIFPRLRIHAEYKIEKLVLRAEDSCFIAEMLKMKNNSIWVGQVKNLKLKGYAVEILPKLKFHKENVMEELLLNAAYFEYTSEMEEMENRSILVGKVGSLDLAEHAIPILPKLRLHEENVMEGLGLRVTHPRHVRDILKMENRSIQIGKVEDLYLEGYAIEILPKLRIHRDCEIDVLCLKTSNPECITEIAKIDSNSICLGKVKRLELFDYAIQILPKLRFHEENEMEVFYLNAGKHEYIEKILKEENNSIRIGKVKKMEIGGHPIEILPKLRIHEENEMEELDLRASDEGSITEILKMENKSIWLGRVKKLSFGFWVDKILPKLNFRE